MMPGMPERRTHDYVRNGITSLFAAFNIADGTVISELHRQHRGRPGRPAGPFGVVAGDPPLRGAGS
jgi:hypothetical protein